MHRPQVLDPVPVEVLHPEAATVLREAFELRPQCARPGTKPVRPARLARRSVQEERRQRGTRRAPHQLARGVVDVARDQRFETRRRRRGRAQRLLQHQDAGVAAEVRRAGPVGKTCLLERRLVECTQGFEGVRVVALERRGAHRAQVVERPDHPACTEVEIVHWCGVVAVGVPRRERPVRLRREARLGIAHDALDRGARLRLVPRTLLQRLVTRRIEQHIAPCRSRRPARTDARRGFSQSAAAASRGTRPRLQRGPPCR